MEISEAEEKIKELHPELFSYSEKRPWGGFEIIFENKNATCKFLNVKDLLSLQKHKMRSELWFVLEGQAEIELGETPSSLKKHILGPGEWAPIPKGAIHRLGGKCRVLEISLGKFDEEDIERFEDKYGRSREGFRR